MATNKKTDHATRDEVLATCRELEEGAAALYRHFAEASPTAKLAALWNGLAAEEVSHAAMVERLENRKGLRLPTIARGELLEVARRIRALRAEGETAGSDVAKMLTVAAALEFSEMDDLFGAVCRAGGIDPDKGRARHLAPLVEAAGKTDAGKGALRHLLAALIRLDRRAKGGAAWPRAAAASVR